MKILGNIFPIILLALLSLAIVFPLLSPGFILTMDQVVAGKIAFPTLVSSPLYLFTLLLWFLNLFIPIDILQKIMIFLIFFLSSWGMYSLLPKNLGMFRIWGGIFYAVNPFVYERVMAGHWPFLLAYGIFPMVVSQLVFFYEDPTPKAGIKLGILLSIIMNLFIHFSLIFAVLLLVYSITYTFFHQNKFKLLTKPFIFFIITTFGLNANWIIPVPFGRSVLSSILNEFDRADIITFQSVADNFFGLPFNLASGYGFWPEVYQYFILPKNLIFFWPLLSAIIIGISIWGVLKLFKEKDSSTYPLIITFVVMLLLSLDFAGGIGLKPFASIFFLLYERIPFLRGLREPQKLVGIIMFCYAYFGSLGIHHFVSKLNKAKYLALTIFFVLPFIYTPTIFGGFWNQLKPVFYPDSWQEADRILTADQDDFIVVIFPWQQYIKPRFNNYQIVANPASYFFSKTTISSLNYDTVPLYTHDSRIEALHVEGLLSIENEEKNLLGDTVYKKTSWGAALSPINVKYIILLKEGDWRKYRFFEESSDLKKVYESDELILYQNLSFGKENLFEEQQDLEFIPELEL